MLLNRSFALYAVVNRSDGAKTVLVSSETSASRSYSYSTEFSNGGNFLLPRVGAARERGMSRARKSTTSTYPGTPPVVGILHTDQL